MGGRGSKSTRGTGGGADPAVQEATADADSAVAMSNLAREQERVAVEAELDDVDIAASARTARAAAQEGNRARKAAAEMAASAQSRLSNATDANRAALTAQANRAKNAADQADLDYRATLRTANSLARRATGISGGSRWVDVAPNLHANTVKRCARSQNVVLARLCLEMGLHATCKTSPGMTAARPCTRTWFPISPSAPARPYRRISNSQRLRTALGKSAAKGSPTSRKVSQALHGRVRQLPTQLHHFRPASSRPEWLMKQPSCQPRPPSLGSGCKGCVRPTSFVKAGSCGRAWLQSVPRVAPSRFCAWLF